MKIVSIETFLADAGWRPWGFVKISTDEGITGYGEATCVFTQYAVLAAVEDLKPTLLGANPLAYEMRFWDMYRRSRLGSVGGVVGKAIGAIECALIDIKAKSLGISVAEMFGGPLRDEIPLYWSHCCIIRSIAPELLGVKPMHSLSAVRDAAMEVVQRGYPALKTNIMFPGDPPFVYHLGFGGAPGTTDQYANNEFLRHAERYIATIRDAVGKDVGIILDLNFNFKPESCIRIAKALEPYELAWLELDMYDPEALLEVKKAVNVPIASLETLFYVEQYRPYFEKRACDIVMLDTPWMGFSQAKKVGDMAQAWQMNVCPHNYYSHLATHISAQLCAVLPNVQIMEFEPEDVPWRDDFITNPPIVGDGHMLLPEGPGWGTDLNEKEVRARPWDGKKRPRVVVPSGFAGSADSDEPIVEEMEIGDDYPERDEGTNPDARIAKRNGRAPEPVTALRSRRTGRDEDGEESTAIEDGTGQVVAFTAYDRIMGPWSKAPAQERREERAVPKPMPQQTSGSRRNRSSDD